MTHGDCCDQHCANIVCALSICLMAPPHNVATFRPETAQHAGMVANDLLDANRRLKAQAQLTACQTQTPHFPPGSDGAQQWAARRLPVPLGQLLLVVLAKNTSLASLGPLATKANALAPGGHTLTTGTLQCPAVCRHGCRTPLNPCYARRHCHRCMVLRGFGNTQFNVIPQNTPATATHNDGPHIDLYRHGG